MSHNDQGERVLAWLQAQVAQVQPSQASPARAPAAITAARNGHSAYGAAALKGELAKVAAEMEGRRNIQLNESALKLGHLVAGGELDEVTVIEELTRAAEDNGLGAKEIADTIRSGMRKGMQEPKSAPDPLISGTNGGTRKTSMSIDRTPAAAADVPAEGAGTIAALMVSGGRFILDAPDTVPAVWGDGAQVVWAEGEALLITGPPGVGKTTLAGQVLSARLGIGGAVLGLPVKPTTSKVLYLAMDRPRQIARSLRRTLGRANRVVLDERLIVWQGPPLKDIAAHPELLSEMARAAGADTVIVDSLKDAAVGLSDDTVGAGYNRARQLCLAAGIEVAELHHMVKRGANGGKPTSLADVYGSVWITAGAGSVLLLWGEPGDPIVEAVHLKQPAEPFGPLMVIHDHDTGTSKVWQETDLTEITKARGEMGITAKGAAMILFSTDNPSPAQVEKARRKLNQLPRLVRTDGSRSTSTPAVWTFTDPFTAPVEREGTTDPSRPSQDTEFSQVADHHDPLHGLHAVPPSRTAPSLYGGGGEGSSENDQESTSRTIPLCACGNVAEPGSDQCHRCGPA